MSQVIEDYSPIYVGNTLIPFAPQFKHKNGAPFSLSGATLSLKMRNTSSGEVKVCNGAWTIQDAANGLAFYKYQAADVNEPGTWELWAAATVSGDTANADPKILVIKEAP
jgi:hypothetical protein